MLPLSPVGATIPNEKGFALRFGLGGYPPCCYNVISGLQHFGARKRVNCEWQGKQKKIKKIHPNSRSPSRSPPTSWSPSKITILRSEVEQSSPKYPSISQGLLSSYYKSESPEVQTLIEKLKQISISAEKPAISQAYEESVSSVLQPRRILTRSISEKIGIPPLEFPITSFRKNTKKSKSQTYISEILSNSPSQIHSLPPHISTNLIQTIGASSSSSGS